MKRRGLTPMHWLVAGALALVASACASIGRPQGGPRDMDPPVFVRSTPSPGGLNFNGSRLDLYFDENLKLEDAFNKVIVSPVMKSPPVVSANGKHITVEFKDTLQANTTYTVDFADAIHDLNEGNPLDGFALDFSTGDNIDSLRISGMVLQARNLEPAQGMIVGAYLVDSTAEPNDTAIVARRQLERVARTNQYGQFTIRNLKEGTYRLFAINDINRDYKWDRSEDIAVYPFDVRPYTTAIEVVDTLRSSEDKDSLVTRPGIAYMPNDLLLTWFNENYAAQYLKDYARPDRRKITLQMAAQSDTLPELTIVQVGEDTAESPLIGRKASDWALLHKNSRRDSLEYWMHDTTVLRVDSLYLSVRYQRTDTADMLAWQTDTLKFFFRDPAPTKKKKDEEEADTLPPELTYINFAAVTKTSHEVYMPLIFDANQPIDTIVESGIHLEMQQDTTWATIDATFRVDSLRPLMRRYIDHKWEPGQKYRLTVDSAAVVGIYNEWNKRMVHEFTVKQLEDYSNLDFHIIGCDSAAVVELLGKSDDVIRRAPVVGGYARFKHLDPGTVYARLFIDGNGNGEWDTGNVNDSIQPEDVYYYPKKINLRKNWDVTQDWDINSVNVDMQKPYDIKKNKPKLKAGEKRPVEDDEDEDGDMDTNVFGTGGMTTNKYTNSRRGGGGMTGGFQKNNSSMR